jgi:hypothetical protein
MDEKIITTKISLFRKYVNSTKTIIITNFKTQRSLIWSRSTKNLIQQSNNINGRMSRKK